MRRIGAGKPTLYGEVSSFTITCVQGSRIAARIITVRRLEDAPCRRRIIFTPPLNVGNGVGSVIGARAVGGRSDLADQVNVGGAALQHINDVGRIAARIAEGVIYIEITDSVAGGNTYATARSDTVVPRHCRGRCIGGTSVVNVKTAVLHQIVKMQILQSRCSGNIAHLNAPDYIVVDIAVDGGRPTPLTRIDIASPFVYIGLRFAQRQGIQPGGYRSRCSRT